MTIPQQVQDLIDGSGNTFHAKVAQWLASNDWNIRVSPYYMDQSQQKARELDLVAEKAWPITDIFGKWQGQVVARLFIECKFVPGHSVFWFMDKNRSAVEEMICTSGGFRKDNFYTVKHHYLASGNRVAKLFTSSNAKGQEAEPFYKALNQSLNALVSLRPQLPGLTHPSHSKGTPMVVLNFPVVIFSSFSLMYDADFFGVKQTTPITDNFQLEVQYAFVGPDGKGRDELFMLDFVEYEKLPSFMQAVESDAKAAATLASHSLRPNE